MSTRITQGMMSIQLLRNLNNNMLRMDSLQNQLSTGRRINKPSDDPVGISYSMRYRSELSSNEQYQSNVDMAVSWLDYTDTTLGQATEVIQRLRELAVSGANGTNSQEALDAIASETSQLYEQMVDIANSDFNGKHVFNGQLTNIKPFTLANAKNESTDTADILFEIGAGVKIAVNVPGQNVFGAATDTDNMFKIFDDMRTTLNGGDSAGMNQVISALDSRMDQFLNLRSEIGAKSNRIELAESRLKDIGLNLQTLRTKTEDADMSIVITNLKISENVYQASLSAGSKLIQPSLLDYLR
ncbi:MAG TPA: flagellar hook-associated protein FlgL [Bacilli bacterium]